MAEMPVMQKISRHYQQVLADMPRMPHAIVSGKITRITGMKIEATGLAVPLNTVCLVSLEDDRTVRTEVVGFSGDTTYLMAAENVQGLHPGARVQPMGRRVAIAVGMDRLGRVLDAMGQPIDGGAPLLAGEIYPLVARPINPMVRTRISAPLDVGIRAINALFTIARGQRMGIFAGSGVGKSVLLGMMTRATSADIVVVGLVGERGREVREFIEESLGNVGRARAVVVAAPADTLPLMRVNSAMLATTLAEYYRDQGMSVLLIIDSLTRYAHALREIALSIGEMPATRGFTPSVFARLSRLIERSGNGVQGSGSITAFYTVLMEGDDHTDPIADHARSVLDGHIMLSRALADSGHYPAIDVEHSISRTMQAVVTEEHLQMATRFRRLFGAYQQNREMINIGMYQSGADPIVDEAIIRRERLFAFLGQGMAEQSNLTDSVAALKHVLE